MSTLKVDKLQGTSGAVTGLTFSGANGTFGGTLAVTGVHTVGNNAIYTSDGGAATQNLAQGLGKAWMNYKGTDTNSIGDSYNVGSVTDGGTGSYTINFTNNMSNIYYTGSIVCVWGNGISTVDTLATSTCRALTGQVTNFSGGASGVDSGEVGVQIMGDLA
jgi:hypothetical protein